MQINFILLKLDEAINSYKEICSWMLIILGLKTHFDTYNDIGDFSNCSMSTSTSDNVLQKKEKTNEQQRKEGDENWFIVRTKEKMVKGYENVGLQRCANTHTTP